MAPRELQHAVVAVACTIPGRAALQGFANGLLQHRQLERLAQDRPFRFRRRTTSLYPLVSRTGICG
jgi:hypothetical protein